MDYLSVEIFVSISPLKRATKGFQPDYKQQKNDCQEKHPQSLFYLYLEKK